MQTQPIPISPKGNCEWEEEFQIQSNNPLFDRALILVHEILADGTTTTIGSLFLNIRDMVIESEVPNLHIKGTTIKKWFGLFTTAGIPIQSAEIELGATLLPEINDQKSLYIANQLRSSYKHLRSVIAFDEMVERNHKSPNLKRLKDFAEDELSVSGSDSSSQLLDAFPELPAIQFVPEREPEPEPAQDPVLVRAQQIESHKQLIAERAPTLETQRNNLQDTLFKVIVSR